MWSSDLPWIVGVSVFGLLALIWLGIVAVDYLPNSLNTQIKTGWICQSVGKNEPASRKQLIQAWGKNWHFGFFLQAAIKQGYVREDQGLCYLTDLGRERFQRLIESAKRD